MPRPRKNVEKKKTEYLNPTDQFFAQSGEHMKDQYGDECVSSADAEDENLFYVEVPDLALQWAIGRQGFALGRIMQIMGFEGAGKTSFALWLTELFYKAGGFGAWIETEYAGSTEHMRYYVSTPDKLRVFHPETIEDAMNMTIDTLNIFAKIDPKGLVPKVIALDSLAGATDSRAVEDEKTVTNRKVGGSSGIIKDATNLIKGKLRETNTLWAVLNQGRDKIDTNHGFGGMIPELDKVIGSGGRAIPFAATYWLILKKLAMSAEAGEKNGFKAKCTFKKNKLRTPFREMSYNIEWGKTLQFEEQTVAFLAKPGICGTTAKKGGLYYSDDLGIPESSAMPAAEYYAMAHSKEFKPEFQFELDIITTDKLLTYTPPAPPKEEKKDERPTESISISSSSEPEAAGVNDQQSNPESN